MRDSPLVKLAEELLAQARSLDSYNESRGLPPVSFDHESFVDLPNDLENCRQAVINISQDIKRLAQGPRDLLFESLNTFNDLANFHFIYHHKLASHVPTQKEISYPELSEITGIDQILLRRMLHYAMINRIFQETPDGCITHSAASRLLKEEPGAMDTAGFFLEEIFPAAPKMVAAMEKYPGSGEPNETAFNLAFNTSRPFYLELEPTPERARRFGGAMRWMSQGGRFSNDHLIRGYDWAAFDHKGCIIVDVGGGHGAVSQALAVATQHVKFVVQDLPVTAIQGRKLLPAALQERVSFMPHDFFEEQPVKGANVYFLRYILHNWSDKYALKILKALVPAMKSGSRIVVYEFLPGDRATTAWTDKQTRHMDMIGAIGWNATERTSSDWDRLFTTVDSRLRFLGTRTPEGCSVSLIEAEFVPEMNGNTAA